MTKPTFLGNFQHMNPSQVIVAFAEGLGTYRLAECSMKLEQSGKQVAKKLCGFGWSLLNRFECSSWFVA